jgi:TRAP-type C4-dicarboxylate transport system substrate-binding protein
MKNLKIRLKDIPAYMAMPKSWGADPTPIAFSKVYLALQSGTVEAQESPLSTIDAKKFYEVQKHTMLTGHIVSAVATQIEPHIWKNLSNAEKSPFTNIVREAASEV